MSRIPEEQLPKTDDEWRERLTPEQFQVARKAGTERAFTGEYWDCHDDGTYECVCCGAPLFSSDTKFESGTGWPSFFQALDPNAVEEKTDVSHGMVRTEAVCRNCGAHLGHVFPDGPRPTGQRYCMNSASLRLDRKEELNFRVAFVVVRPRIGRRPRDLGGLPLARRRAGCHDDTAVIPSAVFRPQTRSGLAEQPSPGSLGSRANLGGPPMREMLIELEVDSTDRRWQERANCLGVDPDLFFPERGASTKEAKSVCGGCEVKMECLEYALRHGEKFGIWGGMSERERRRIRRQRALVRRGLASASGA